jgi:hypothetical protein
MRYQLTVYTDQKIQYTLKTIEADNIQSAIMEARREIQESFNPGPISYCLEDMNSGFCHNGRMLVK